MALGGARAAHPRQHRGLRDLHARPRRRFYSAEDVATGKPDAVLREAREHGRYEEEGWRVRKDGSRFWADI
ncbi:MAG: hypothetical protein ACJ79L_15610, partial [Anaeromyxobacteraceae bacterium]